MTKSLKREVKKVTDTMDEGKKRLRKLGILKDGGGEESGEDEDMDDLKDDEKEEANEEDEDEEESGEESGEESEEESGEEEEVEVEEAKEKKEESKQQKTVAVPAAPGAALPFTFPMPATPQALEKIVGALSPVDAAVALDRIRKCHAPTLREDNRKKTQLFFGLLLQRFEVLAGAASIPVAHLDVLAAALAAVAVSVPFFAVTAARARLEKMAARLRRALRDGQTGWPPARTLLLLALFADLFPATDKQHPVTTPAALYLGHVMSHCAVRSAREAVTAVVAGALAAAYSAPAGRVFPEAVTLLAGLVHAAGVGDASRDGAWGEGLPLHVREQVGGPWLAPDMTPAALDAKKQSKKKKGEVEEALSLASGANGGLSLDGGRQLGASQPISIEGGGGLLSLATMLSMSSAGAGGAEANPG
jgi:nucleolar protein 14